MLSHVSLTLYILLYLFYLRSRLFLPFCPMSDDTLIVPTILPSGSLHFASVHHDGTVSDVINYLSDNGEVKSDVLDDLPPCGWALQLIRKEPPGRQWEEDELESLGDGTYVWNLFPVSTNCTNPTFRSSGRDGQDYPLDSDHTIRSFASASFLGFRPDIPSSFTCLTPRLFTPLAVRLSIISSRPRNSRWLCLEVLFLEKHYCPRCHRIHPGLSWTYQVSTCTGWRHCILYIRRGLGRR